MMKYEFERIAGYEVSEEDYSKIIEPMYNATDLDKDEFVKCIDRKRFEIKREIPQEIIELEAKIKIEIEELNAEVKKYMNAIKVRKEYLENETDEVWINAWKYDIKCYRKRVRECKQKIVALKMILK